MVRILKMLGPEDWCLGLGAASASVGAGLALGLPCGLIAAGVLAMAYGIWITGGER